MNDIFPRLALLLDVLHKAAAAGPQFAWIVSTASDEIAKMQDHPSSIPAPAPETINQATDESEEEPVEDETGDDEETDDNG